MTATKTLAGGVSGDGAPPASFHGEEWRPIADLPHYKVSDQGRVLSCHPRWRAPRLMHPRTNAYGYFVVSLLDADGALRPSLLVHRLVAEAFIGPRVAGMDTRHLDGDKANNAASNLAYGTRSQNELDKVGHGAHHWANKTHCPRNHPYDEANTRHSRGKRWCRACDRVRGSGQSRAATRAAVRS